MKSNADLLPSLIVPPETTIIDAVSQITHAARKILLVADGARHLLGVVTDYDVRRAILDHIDFASPVEVVMSRHPVAGKAGMSRTEILALIREKACAQVPLLDAEGRIVDIHFMDEYLNGDSSPRMAVVMAGGQGKRLRPFTEHTPKPLLTVAGRPIIFILLDQLLSEGIERVYVSVNYKADMIKKAVMDVPRYRNHVAFLEETEELGTAGPLGLLPSRPDEPFLVVNADVLTSISMQEMLRYHAAEGNEITLATKRDVHSVPYGVVDLDGSQVTGLVEKPKYVYFVNTGVYVLNPSVLDLFQGGGSRDMPDVIAQALQTGKRVGSFPVHEYWLDIGNHEHYARAQEDFIRLFGDGANGEAES